MQMHNPITGSDARNLPTPAAKIDKPKKSPKSKSGQKRNKKKSK